MKRKTCTACGAEFLATNMGQKACSVPCALQYTRQKRENAARKSFKAETRRRKASLRTPSDACKAAQKAFNKYIRVRDMGSPCISCGKPLQPGKGTHAGHYRTTAAASQLRFNTYNCHAQCYSCNTAKSGAIGDYRIAIVQRYGEERVEWLDNYNAIAAYDMDYYNRIRDVFNKRARHLAKLRGH